MQSITILVIDDDDDIRASVKTALELEGHVVHDAPDGYAGLEIMRSTPGLGLVLLDLTMPGLSGHEVLAIRARDSVLNGIPVVVLSAVSNLKASLADAPPVQGILGKPIELDELFDAVTRCCRAAQPSDLRAGMH